MEETHAIQRINCQFSSQTINQLQLILFPPNGDPLQHLLMIQSHKYQIHLFPSLTHCYATTLLFNRQEDFNFCINFQEKQIQTAKEKQYQFEHFTFTVEMQITSNHPHHIQQIQQVELMNKEKLNLILARSFLIKAKQKVLMELGKQNFIRCNKRKSKIIPKAKLGRSKTKKNLTAIYYRNINNELVGKNFQKDMEKSQANFTLLDQHQIQTITNNLILQINKSAFGALNYRNPQKDKIILAEKDKSTEEKKDGEVPEVRLSVKIEKCQKERSIRYLTGTSKSKYLQNLERETVLTLQIQKKQLDFLKTLAAKDKQSSILTNICKQPENHKHENKLVVQRRCSAVNNYYTFKLPK